MNGGGELDAGDQVALQALARLKHQLAQRRPLDDRPLNLAEHAVETLEGFDGIAQLDVGRGLDLG